MKTYTKQFIQLQNSKELKPLVNQIKKMVELTYKVTNKTEGTLSNERTEAEARERTLYCNLRGELNSLEHQIHISRKNSDMRDETTIVFSLDWIPYLGEYFQVNEKRVARNYPTLKKFIDILK